MYQNVYYLCLLVAATSHVALLTQAVHGIYLLLTHRTRKTPAT